MTFLGLKMIIFGHFSRFLASFNISSSSLQHPRDESYRVKHTEAVSFGSHNFESAAPALSHFFSLVSTNQTKPSMKTGPTSAGEKWERARSPDSPGQHDDF